LCVDETLPDLQIKLVLAQTAPEARGNYEIFLRRDTATVDSRRGGASLAFCIDERRAYGRCDHRIILPPFCRKQLRRVGLRDFGRRPSFAKSYPMSIAAIGF
jgi:hypothetical protein